MKAALDRAARFCRPRKAGLARLLEQALLDYRRNNRGLSGLFWKTNSIDKHLFETVQVLAAVKQGQIKYC
jgi:hypothetical protein